MPGLAQEWPAKTVRILVPFGPGSTPNIVARLIAEGLTKKYPDSTFLVENKPGASGNLATDVVAKAAPNGATLGISIGGPLAINTLLFSNLPYDPRKDIAPIAQLVTQPSVLVVNPELKVDSVTELLALLKKNPGKYNLVSIGNGSLSHLADASDRYQGRRAIGTCALSGVAAGDHGGDPQRRAACLFAGDLGDAASRGRNGKNSRGLDRQTLALSAGRADLERSRDRRGGRCLERTDRTGRYA